MPARQQRGCRCQRPHKSVALPHFLVLPSKLKALADMVNEKTERLQILQATVESMAGELNCLEEGK